MTQFDLAFKMAVFAALTRGGITDTQLQSKVKDAKVLRWTKLGKVI